VEGVILKIVVCAKGVPSETTNIKVADGGNRLTYRAYQLNINESDDYALEQAVVLKKQHGGDITMITVGTSDADRVSCVGLVKGVDRAVRIDTDFADPEVIAELLAAAVRDTDYDLILCGVESSDNMSSEVAVSFAERLGLPFAYAVTKVEVTDDTETVSIKKEMGGGVEQMVEISLPALLCIQTGIVPMRYAPLREILKARSKPIETIPVSDLSQSAKTNITFLDVFPPPKQKHAKIIEGELTEIARIAADKVKEALQ
jgi:electron transfer flavoprotein beta subunit